MTEGEVVALDRKERKAAETPERLERTGAPPLRHATATTTGIRPYRSEAKGDD